MKILELEKIYNDVISEYNRINRFNDLTSITYDLALASVEKENNIKSLPKIKKDDIKKEFSYSPADREIESVELKCGWITYEEYSDKMGVSVDIVKEKAENGELGKIEEKNGKKVLFWTSQEMNSEEIPSVNSKNTYSIKYKIKGTAKCKVEGGVEEIVSFLGSTDKLEKQTSEAKLLLNRETFLLYWSTFEQYVKNITVALFELFPEQVFKNKKYGKNQMSYLEIFEGSTQLTDIVALKERIIDSIISDPATDKEAISKQISFIKECYLERSEDPYKTWYVIRGEKNEIDYTVLDQIRKIRNALVHKNGEMIDEWDCIDIIERPTDNRIIIDDNLLLMEEMILKSISHNLYRLVSNSLSH